MKVTNVLEFLDLMWAGEDIILEDISKHRINYTGCLATFWHTHNYHYLKHYIVEDFLIDKNKENGSYCIRIRIKNKDY